MNTLSVLDSPQVVAAQDLKTQIANVMSRAARYRAFGEDGFPTEVEVENHWEPMKGAPGTVITWVETDDDFGCSVLMLDIPQGSTLHRHRHDEALELRVIRGIIEGEIDGVPFVATPEDPIYIPAKALHTMNARARTLLVKVFEPPLPLVSGAITEGATPANVTDRGVTSA